MGALYCTKIDVKQVAKTFSSDFDRNDPVLDTEIDVSIAEASNITREALSIYHDIADIDALVPYPPAVINFTKIIAAVIIITQWSQVSGTNADKIIARLKDRAKHYKKQIQNRNLLKDDGTIQEGVGLSTSYNVLPPPDIYPNG